MSLAIFDLLLAGHIGLGAAALLAGCLALLSRKGGRLHRAGGRIFAGAMAVVLATALLMAVLHPNPFLFAIALFSGYLAFTGWRAARVRRSSGTGRLDRAAAAGMLLVGAGMAAHGLAALADLMPGGDYRAWVLLAFGAAGAGFAGSDLRLARRGGVEGAARIVRHVGRMGGAFIATVTAVAVVNLDGLPDLVAWLGPSVLLTPLHAWFSARTLRAARRPRARAAGSARPVEG